MCGVGLDQARGGWVEEADVPVLASGEEVLAAAGGEGEGVDGGGVGAEASEGCGWEGGHYIFGGLDIRPEVRGGG